MSAILKSSAEPRLNRREALLSVAGKVTSISIVAYLIESEIRKYLSTIVNAGANAASLPGEEVNETPLTLGKSSLRQPFPGRHDLETVIMPVPPRRFDPSPAFTIGLDYVDRKKSNKDRISLGEISANPKNNYKYTNFAVPPEIEELVGKYPHLESSTPPLTIEQIVDLINGGVVNRDRKEELVSSAFKHWFAGRKKAFANKITTEGTEPLTGTHFLQE